MTRGVTPDEDGGGRDLPGDGDGRLARVTAFPSPDERSELRRRARRRSDQGVSGSAPGGAVVDPDGSPPGADGSRDSRGSEGGEAASRARHPSSRARDEHASGRQVAWWSGPFGPADADGDGAARSDAGSRRMSDRASASTAVTASAPASVPTPGPTPESASRSASGERSSVVGGSQRAGDRASRRAANVSLHQLARRGMSRWELEQVLVRREVDPAAAAAELDRLESVGLLDDAALAVTLVRTQHARRGLGRQALAAELRRRHIATDVIEDALGELGDDEEQERVTELARDRARRLEGLERTVAERRLSGFLARKGYGSSLVRHAVQAALDDAYDAPGARRPRFEEDPDGGDVG